MTDNTIYISTEIPDETFDDIIKQYKKYENDRKIFEPKYLGICPIKENTENSYKLERKEDNI